MSLQDSQAVFLLVHLRQSVAKGKIRQIAKIQVTGTPRNVGNLEKIVLTRKCGGGGCGRQNPLAELTLMPCKWIALETVAFFFSLRFVNIWSSLPFELWGKSLSRLP